MGREPVVAVALAFNEESKMKKRLRKKLRVGEFAKHSFEVAFIPAAGVDGERMQNFCCRAEAWGFARAESLSLGFGWTVEEDGSVVKSCGGLATLVEKYGDVGEDDRIAVAEWMRAQPEVREVWVGPLIDSYHCDGWWPVVGPDDTKLPAAVSAS